MRGGGSRRSGCGLNDDGAGRGAREALAVGHDVGDGVGRGGAGVELDGALKRAVEVGLNAEVEIGLGAGDGRSEVGVARADLDDGRVVAVDLDHGRGVGRVRWRRRWGSGRAAD